MLFSRSESSMGSLILLIIELTQEVKCVLLELMLIMYQHFTEEAFSAHIHCSLLEQLLQLWVWLLIQALTTGNKLNYKRKINSSSYFTLANNKICVYSTEYEYK